MSISVKNYASRDIRYNKDVVTTVNKMYSVKFRINRSVFDILIKKNYFKSNGEKLLNFKIHDDTELLGKYQNEKNYIKIHEITSYNSKYLYNTTILNIASLMYECEEIYFTNFLDWRGRIYTSTCSLNIPGGEVSRGLILFKDGEILSEKGVYSLKVYMANAFGLDKRSKSYRVKWVENHIDEIINVPENNIWLEADEPRIFLVCALELQEYIKNPKFLSRLPILIDATCNGLQHLSSMACDIQLANKVNIGEFSNGDDPRDVYSELIPPPPLRSMLAPPDGEVSFGWKILQGDRGRDKEQD